MTISYVDFTLTKLAGYFPGLRAGSYKGDDGQLPANDLMFSACARGVGAYPVSGPEPRRGTDERRESTWPMTLLGFAGLSLARYRKVRRARARSG